MNIENQAEIFASIAENHRFNARRVFTADGSLRHEVDAYENHDGQEIFAGTFTSPKKTASAAVIEAIEAMIGRNEITEPPVGCPVCGTYAAGSFRTDDADAGQGCCWECA